MIAPSTLTHVVKAFLGGSLTSQIHLASGSQGQSLTGRLAGHLAMHTIKNAEADLIRRVSRCELPTEEIVKGAIKLADLRNQIKPAEGPVGTQVSMATNELLKRVQEKCGSQKAVRQLDMALSQEQKYERAMKELKSAHSSGKLKTDGKDGEAFSHAVSLVAMLGPRNAGNFEQHQTRIVDELLAPPRQVGIKLTEAEYQREADERSLEHVKELIAFAQDGSNNATAVVDKVKFMSFIIGSLKNTSLSEALHFIKRHAESETGTLGKSLERAIASVWYTEVHLATNLPASYRG